MDTAFALASVALGAISYYADAFQPPLPLLVKPLAAAGSSSFLATTTDSSSGALSSLLQANNDITTAVYQHHQHASNTYFWIAEDGGSGGVFDTVRSVAAGVTAVLFLLAGLTYAYASFIIPAAALELEKECKELDPQLWDQFASKLKEGETMASRPDLMQEMGEKLQPLVTAKLKALDDAGLPTPLETTMNPFSTNKGDAPPSVPTSSASQWDNNDDVIIASDDAIDVEVEKKSKWD